MVYAQDVAEAMPQYCVMGVGKIDRPLGSDHSKEVYGPS